MVGSPFKTFVKLRKIEHTYEDDCKIFYPTPWDQNYRIYYELCLNAVPISPTNAQFTYDEEIRESDESRNPLINTSETSCQSHEEHNEIFLEPREQISLTNYDIIPLYDNKFKNIQLDYFQCKQPYGYMPLMPCDDRLFFDEESVNLEDHQDDDQLHRGSRRQPSIINFEHFIFNTLQAKSNIVKQKKFKKLRTKKVKNVHQKNICAFVEEHVEVALDDIATKDVHCKTYSKVLASKLPKLSLIYPSLPSKGVDFNSTPKIDKALYQIATRDDQQPKTYSESLSGNLITSRIIKQNRNKERDLNTTQINKNLDQDPENIPCRRYSEVVYCNLPKSTTLIKQRVSTEKINFHVNRIENTYDQSTKDTKTCKTYSEIVYYNLPRLIKQKISRERIEFQTTQVENTFDQQTTDVSNCTTYSQVVYSKLTKQTSSKEVNLKVSHFDGTFTEDVPTLSQVVSCCVVSSLSSIDHNSNEQVPSDFDMPISQTRSQIVCGEIHDINSAKYEKDLVMKIKSPKVNDKKCDKKKKRRFVKFDLSKTPVLKIAVENPPEPKQSEKPMLSYANVTKKEETAFSSSRLAPKQSGCLEVQPKLKSYADSVIGVTQQSVLSNTSLGNIDDCNYYLETETNASLCQRISFEKKEDWLLIEPKHKRSKRKKK